MKLLLSTRKILLALSVGITVTACGGGSDGGSATASTSTPLQSEIVGSISGISYTSLSYSGTTDQDGAFQYNVGETVSFSVGQLSLGTVASVGQYTSIGNPVGADNEIDVSALNAQSLLMALDVDSNPDNGIELIPEANNLANIDLSDAAAVESALAAIDPALQLPTAAEVIAAYEAALFEKMDKFIEVASYETITSYIVPAASPATNDGCLVFTGATFNISKDSNDQKVYSGDLLISGNAVESFSFSGSLGGYTSDGAYIKMWNMTDSTGLLSINSGEAHLYDAALTGTECRQQVRMKNVNIANSAPGVNVGTFADGLDACGIQANLNILFGGTGTGTPYSVTTYVVANDTDGVLESVSVEPVMDGVSQQSADLIAGLGTSSTTESAKYGTMCPGATTRYLTNYSWDDSTTPVPHLMGCHTVQVDCGSEYESKVTVTDDQGLTTTVSSEKYSSTASTATTTTTYGSYSIDGGPSGSITSVWDMSVYNSGNIGVVQFNFDDSMVLINLVGPVTAGTYTILSDNSEITTFGYDNGIYGALDVDVIDGIPAADTYSVYVDCIDPFDPKCTDTSGTLVITDLGTYYRFDFSGSLRSLDYTDWGGLPGQTIHLTATMYYAKIDIESW